MMWKSILTGHDVDTHLRVDFTAKYQTSCVQQLNLDNEISVSIHIFWNL